jgi:hypothetical protein
MPTLYSKKERFYYLLLFFAISICVIWFILWIYKTEVRDIEDGKHTRDALYEIEQFVGNRPWVPEWSELVQARSGIPIANLFFSNDSIAIPTKMIPYSMIVIDISTAIILDNKKYVDPSTILLSNEWKELLAMIPSKVPYDYTQREREQRAEYESRSGIGTQSQSQTKSSIDVSINADTGLESDRVHSLKTQTAGRKLDPEYKDLLSWIIKKQQENDAIHQRYGFVELPGFTYDYYKPASKQGKQIDFDEFDPVIQKVYRQINSQFESRVDGKMQCANILDRCKLSLVDWRLLKAGENPSSKERVIEAQLLLTDNRQMYILVRVVASTRAIYTVYLEGYEYRSNWSLQNQLWQGRDTDSSKAFLGMKPVRINSHPVIGEYKGAKGYLYSSTEASEGIPKWDEAEIRQMVNAHAMSMRDIEKKYIPRCFGKLALSKSECEILYSPDGTPYKSIGVWDSMCRRNEDCPFYKANKNYPNEFGRCDDGVCQMPLGVTQISPMKYREGDRAVCYQCIDGKGTDCCKDQENRGMYPNLKSADYAFEGDKDARRPYFK